LAKLCTTATFYGEMVKAKSSLLHAVEAYGGGGVASLILNLGARWRYVASLPLSTTWPKGEEPTEEGLDDLWPVALVSVRHYQAVFIDVTTG